MSFPRVYPTRTSECLFLDTISLDVFHHFLLIFAFCWSSTNEILHNRPMQCSTVQYGAVQYSLARHGTPHQSRAEQRNIYIPSIIVRDGFTEQDHRDLIKNNVKYPRNLPRYSMRDTIDLFRFYCRGFRLGRRESWCLKWLKNESSLTLTDIDRLKGKVQNLQHSLKMFDTCNKWSEVKGRRERERIKNGKGCKKGSWAEGIIVAAIAILSRL